MNKDLRIEELLECMECQAELLSDFAASQDLLKAQVEKAAWPSVEIHLTKLRQQADAIQRLDSRRTQLVSQLGSIWGTPAVNSIGEMISLAPDTQQPGLKQVASRLQGALWQVHKTTRRLGCYFESLTDTLDLVLDELIPQRKGKLYARDGMRKAWADNSFVVNTEL